MTSLLNVKTNNAPIGPIIGIVLVTTLAMGDRVL